jgi:hypothetical protein
VRSISIIIALLCVLSTGCIVHHNHRGTSRSHVKSSKSSRCHPSQTWNGSRCIHKGKGRGARKHDG